jgi:hypothetical protein
MSSLQSPALRSAYNQNLYILKRGVFNLLGKKSRMFDAQGNLLFYCERKAFKLKEDIRVFADESRGTELLAIRARAMFDLGATYDVVDSPTGQAVGALRRKAWKSVVRDEWIILGAGDQQIGRIIEDSAVAAALRRLIDLVSLIVPQSFTITIHEQQVGVIKQQLNPFVLSYTMDLRADSGFALDRRLAVAAAVLLLNIEGRQN